MKKWLLFAVIGLLVALMASLEQTRIANNKWKTAMANVKAYNKELSTLKNKSTAYQLTIDQLNTYQDSILKELNATRKELGIKDKKLQSMQYISSTFTVTDTLVLNDTVFKEPDFLLDTLIKDDWYSVGLWLKYPATVAVSPEFKSEKHVFVSTKKETVNPPKKFFIARWFQKKHTVLKVDVVEKNPYVKDGNSKYIDVIK